MENPSTRLDVASLSNDYCLSYERHYIATTMGFVMSKNSPQHPDEIPDPNEAIIVKAEWIISDELIASKLEKLAERRRQRGEEIDY